MRWRFCLRSRQAPGQTRQVADIRADASVAGFAGGGTGAWLGMQVFRHKTRKTKFRVLIPLSVLLWLVIIVWLAWTGGML